MKEAAELRLLQKMDARLLSLSESSRARLEREGLTHIEENGSPLQGMGPSPTKKCVVEIKCVCVCGCGCVCLYVCFEDGELKG